MWISCYWTERLSARDEPGFRRRQVWEWAARGAESYAEMTNLPSGLRDELAREVPFSSLRVVREALAADGTEKALFETGDGRPVEAVLMRYRDGRRSLCVSSQSGCPLTCTFCATGQMRFGRNLSASEILDQALHFRRKEPVNHAVFMGMGEPLMNLDSVLAACERLPDVGIAHSNVGVSTVGWIPGIERMTVEGPPVRLALSLRADEALRSELMPVNERYPLPDVLEACLALARASAPPGVRRVRDARRRERPLRAGAGARGAARAAARLQGQPDPLQPHGRSRIEGRAARRSPRSRTPSRSRGVRATVRLTRGREIAAACGQLAARARAGLLHAERAQQNV